jgi:hypothetical protein
MTPRMQTPAAMPGFLFELQPSCPGRDAAYSCRFAEPGPFERPCVERSRLCGASSRTLHRVRDKAEQAHSYKAIKPRTAA